jgi:hypothetical protein
LIGDTCGGDIEGVWKLNSLSPPPRPIPDDVNSCWNLMLGYSMEDAHLIARTWLQGELAPFYHGTWRFDPVYARQADLGYVIQEEFEGPVVQTYAPECLVTDRGPVTCEALGPALVSPSEPDYTNVTCTPTSAGGCDCTFETRHIAGWADDVVVTDATVTFQRYINSQTPVETLTTTYCVEQGDLRFGAAINTWWPDMHNRPFIRLECDNGVWDPGEEAIDCGGWCDQDCP